MLHLLMNAVSGVSLSVDTGVVLCAMLLILVYLAVFKRDKYQNSAVAAGDVPEGLILPPCLPRLPIIGSAPFMIKKFDNFFGANLMKKLPSFLHDTSKQLGSVFAFYAMSTLVLSGCIINATQAQFMVQQN